MPARTRAHDKKTARARQVKGFWKRLDALEEAGQTTPLQDECLQFLEQDGQLRSKLDVLLIRDPSTRDSSPDPEPWPATWESNPHSLRAQLRWISKWVDHRVDQVLDATAKQFDDFAKDDEDLPLLSLSHPSPSLSKAATSTERQAKNPGPDNPTSPPGHMAAAKPSEDL